MTKKQHIIYFIVLLFSCILLIFTLDAPARNFIPIVWGVFGFVFHGLMLGISWRKLSSKLINEHKPELEKMKIGFVENRFKTSVDILAMFHERQKLETISEEVKTVLSFCRIYFGLTVLALVMCVVLGNTPVFLAGK